MSKFKDWLIGLMEEGGYSSMEEAYFFYQIQESRKVVEQLKADIKQHRSKFDYDSLQEINAELQAEIKTRPEEFCF